MQTVGERCDPVCGRPPQALAVGARRVRSNVVPRSRALTRRRFLLLGSTLPFAVAVVQMLRGLSGRSTGVRVALPADLPVGLTVLGEVIASRAADGSVRAFAARCTHLGCRLDRVIDGQIACPCHGSRFLADGRVATGPAVRSLDELAVVRDAVTGGWIAHAR